MKKLMRYDDDYIERRNPLPCRSRQQSTVLFPDGGTPLIITVWSTSYIVSFVWGSCHYPVRVRARGWYGAIRLDGILTRYTVSPLLL